MLNCILLDENEALVMYREHEGYRFIKNLLKDDDNFVNEVTNYNQGALTIFQNSLNYVFSDHENLLALVLKLKKLMKAANLMIGSLVFSEALDSIVDETCESLECDRASIFIHDPEKQELWSKSIKGSDSTIRIPSHKEVAGNFNTIQDVEI